MILLFNLWVHMLATIAELLLKLLHDFNLQNMTIWLCEHDSSHFIMFRQVEVIRNGLPAAAELPLIADMSDPIDIVAMPLHSPICIYEIDCVGMRQLDSFLLAIRWKTLALFWSAINPHSSNAAFEKYCRNWWAMMQNWITINTNCAEQW